jgi:tetratricopeptide (TPR) repeat protein
MNLTDPATGNKMSIPLWNVPYNRNSHFTGRAEDLASLSASLSSNEPARRVQAIYGLGGVGKTQLALEYAYRYRGQYGIVWWISADEPATLSLTYAKLATRLGMELPEGASLEDIRRALRRKLNDRSDWLLIFDNASGPETVRNFLPQDRTGHVIVTSRNPNWGSLARPWPLKPLKRFESVDFLAQRTGRAGSDTAIARLAQALGDLPLALEQAGACIEQTGITFTEYLQRFETHWAELLKDQRPGAEYPDSVAMTWELSFRQIQDDAPEAADLLNLAAFLAPDDIRRGMLRSGADQVPALLSVILADPLALGKAINALLTYSLVDANEKSFSVHRLVSALVRDRLSDEERQTWAGAAVKLVQSAFKFDSHDLASWEICAALLPHALAAAGHAEALGAAPRLTVSLLEDAGRYLQKRAQYVEAKYVLERAMALAITFYGENHPRVSAVANNLGRVHTELGNSAEAVACFERSLKIDKSTYGESDPHVAAVVNNYGVSLHNSGDRESARRQFEWALSVYEMHYGPEHAKVASVVNNLGYVLHSAGDLEGARTHFERALAIAQSSYGPSHPIIASILTNLGIVFRLQGKFEVAREKFERALAIDEAAHGPNHPAVARAVGHLGALFQDLSLFEAARQNFQRAMRIDELVYGPSHPVIATRLVQLGKVLKEMDDLPAAQACYARAAAIQRGSQSPKEQSSPDAMTLMPSTGGLDEG